MRVKVSESESFIELSCPKRKPKGLKPMKKAFAEKYGKSFGYKANDSFDVTFWQSPRIMLIFRYRYISSGISE